MPDSFVLLKVHGSGFSGAPGLRRLWLVVAATLWLVTAAPARANDSVTPNKKSETRPAVESELVYSGLASYGHYKIFASGSGSFMYTAGVEYDRNSWGKLLGARFDYAAEFLPVVLLREGNRPDIWGTPQAPGHHMVPGVGVFPIGFRLVWRNDRAVMPYFESKGGILAFTEKAMSSQGAYENFSLQSAMGVKLKMKGRWDLRLGLFSDFHFSDAFVVPVNPGLDVMNANVGLVYHLNGRKSVR